MAPRRRSPSPVIPSNYVVCAPPIRHRLLEETRCVLPRVECLYCVRRWKTLVASDFIYDLWKTGNDRLEETREMKYSLLIDGSDGNIAVRYTPILK